MPKTDPEKRLEIIAKCSRCRRGFVWVNPACDMIDHFAPAQWSGVTPNSDGECGGTIVLTDADSIEPQVPVAHGFEPCKPER